MHKYVDLDKKIYNYSCEKRCQTNLSVEEWPTMEQSCIWPGKCLTTLITGFLSVRAAALDLGTTGHWRASVER